MLAPLTAGNLTRLPGIGHGFFGRTGGVSGELYGSLNCGLGSSDDTERVLENRRRVADHLSAGANAVLTLHQSHSAVAVLADRHIPRGELPKADAIVTRTKGLVIGALAADCAPVLLADAEAGVVAAAHSGWRGAVGGILAATVEAMVAAGARRSAIVAAVGPCISQPSYEVGHDFKADLIARDEGNAAFFVDGPAGKPHFDLPGFVVAALKQTGIGDIERQAPCTYTNDSHFYSFRRSTHRGEPDYGRQISAIVLL